MRVESLARDRMASSMVESFTDDDVLTRYATLIILMCCT